MNVSIATDLMCFKRTRGSSTVFYLSDDLWHYSYIFFFVFTNYRTAFEGGRQQLSVVLVIRSRVPIEPTTKTRKLTTNKSVGGGSGGSGSSNSNNNITTISFTFRSFIKFTSGFAFILFVNERPIMNYVTSKIVSCTLSEQHRYKSYSNMVDELHFISFIKRCVPSELHTYYILTAYLSIVACFLIQVKTNGKNENNVLCMLASFSTYTLV